MAFLDKFDLKSEQKKLQDRQYEEFKQEFSNENNILPKIAQTAAIGSAKSLERGDITADEFKSRAESYRSYLGDDVANQLIAVGNQKGVYDIAKSFEEGKISAGDFITKIEGYRSYLGDDTTNQLIAGADQYGREYPAMYFNYATQQYLPQDVADLRDLTPDEIAKQIEYLKNEAIPLAEEKAAASKKAFDIEAGRSYGEARTGKDKEGNSTIGKGRDPELDAAAQTMRADKEALKKLKQELENYEQTTSLKREIDAYNSLSDEDKAILGDYIFNYGVFWKYGDYLTGGPDALTDAEKNAYQKSKQEKEQLISRLQQNGVDTNDLEDFIETASNSASAYQQSEVWERRADTMPVLSSIQSVFLKATDIPTATADIIGTNISNLATGDNKPIDVNSDAYIGTRAANTIRERVSENIESAHPDAETPLIGGNYLSGLYNLGMSTGDSLLALPFAKATPAAPLVVMGAEAGIDAAIDATQRGASAGQALSSAVLFGVAEAAFEKLPLDELFKMAKTSPGGIKNLLSRTAKSMGINATEEELTEISNIASDILIMQDKSSYELSIKNYMEKEGLTREEAEKRATIDLAKQVGLAGLGGVAQGGGMSLVGNVIGHLNVSSTGRQIIATPNGIETLLGAAEQGDAAVRKAADAVRQNPSAGNVGNLAAALQEYTKQPVGNVLAYPSQVKAMHNGEFTPPVNTTSAASATAGRAANATPPMVNTTPPENMAAEAANTGGTDGADTSPASAAAAQSEALSGPVQQVAGIISQSNITSSQADRIVKSPELSSAFTELTGKALDGLTNAEKRQAVQDSAGYVMPDVQSAEVSGVAEPSVLQEDSGTGSGLVYDDYVNNSLEPATANQIDRVAKLLGTRVRFVDSVRGGTANAQIRGREILVERNNPNPVRFLLGHEWTHLMQESAPQAYMSFRNAIASELQGEARALLDLYRQQGEILSTEAALDEAAANMAGRMLEDGRLLDEFIERHRDNKSLLRRMWEAVKRLVHKLTGAERKMAQTAEGKLAAALDEAAESAANENAAQTSGDTRFSIKYDQDNTPYVVVENDILRGVPKSQWIDTVKENLARKFPDGVHVGNNIIKINSQTRREMTYSEYTKWLSRNDRNTYADKFRSSEYADEIILASRDYINEGLKHARKDNIRDFARGNVLLQVGGKDYTADVIVGTTRSGELLLYDIVNLQRTTINEKSRHAVQSGQKGDRRSGMPTTHSISQTGGKSNTRFSLKETTAEEQKQHREAALDYFGETNKWSETGYLLTDGSKLDFSGRHEGGPGGYRTVDHRDISDALEDDYGGDDYSGAMVQFMSEGNIRISPESDGINLSVRPTQAQESALDDFISKAHGEVTLDIDTPDGQTVASVEYPSGTRASKVIGDIRAYFENGTLPSVSELARFHNSLKGSEDARSVSELERENRELRERVEHFKEQLHRSNGITTDKESTRREARQLIQDYGADLDADDIAGDLQSLYDFMASGKEGENELSYDAVRERADAIARRVVENAVETGDNAYRQYGDLRAYLRSNKLVISPEDSRSIPDFNRFRKSNFGRMNIGTRGESNIDQVYTELSTLYPELFDEQRETTPADRLQRIAEVAGEIYDTSLINLFSQYMEESVTGVSNDILERFFDLTQTGSTLSERNAKQLQGLRRQNWQRTRDVIREERDRQEKQLQDLRRRNRQRTRDAIRKERDRQEKRINRLKTQYRARTAEARERQDAREMRARIIRHANQLSKKLLRPSDKQHIPESLRTAVASLLESVNLESAYSVDPETGKRVKDGSGTPTKRTEAARELRLAYSQILKDGTGDTMTIDPDLMDNLDEMASMKDTPLMAMNAEQLQTVWATVKAVEASIQNANRVLGESRYKDISEIAEGIRDDNAGRKDRGNYRAPIDAADKLTRIDMLEPYSFLHQLGPTGDVLWDMQRGAQDRYIRRIAELEKASSEIIGKTDITALDKQTHSFDIRGQKLTLTTPQIMELLELTKRPQAQEHILVGGVRPEAVRTGAGIRESRPSEAVRLTPDDIARITGTLTKEQTELADKLQAYLSNTVSEWGNETSMEVYGYRKFTDPHYYPIRVDRNQVQRDVSNEAQAATIAGRGFTKTTTPNANNAVMLQSIFDTFYSHAKDMASYSGWVTAMENLRRIRNFNFRDADGNRTGSVQAVLEKVFGKEGPAYLDKLMDDINRGGGDADVGFTERFASNYKAAAVGTNLRVMAQQPTSFVRAAAMINPKYLTQGVFNRVDWNLVKEYAPIAQWKDWGFFDISTGRQMRDIILHTDSRLEKLKQSSMRGAGFMDRQTWKSLWRAVELETRDTHPDLKPGTKEFYQAVGERFSRVIDRTQVVDGVLQRSQIMRSKNWLNRTASSFMSEPTKIYNMMLNSAYDMRHAPTKSARKAAFRALGRTSFALLASFVANSVAQSLIDAMRDDDDEKNYGDKFLAAFLGFSGDEETFMDYFGSFWSGNLEASMNPLEYIPYVKDALSLLKGYDVSRMDMEPIAKLITAGQNLFSGKYSTAGSVSNFVAEASRIFGLSPANLIRDVKGIFNTITDATHAYVAQYYVDKFFLDLGYEGNVSELKGLLEKAKENDMGDYEIIYADAWKNGYLGAQKIFDKEAPDSVTQNKKTYDLDAEQQEEYQDIISEATTKYLSDLEKRSAYKKMDYEEKESVAESLYDYATALAKAEVVPEYELEQSKALMERLEDAGVSAADQILIKKTADTDGNGRLTNDEYEEAVNNSWLQEWAKELMLAVYEANNKRDKEKREKAVDRAFDQHSR